MSTPRTTPSESRLAAESMIENLEVVGRAMRNHELVTMDLDTIGPEGAHALGIVAERPEIYARTLVLETTCTDEGMNLLLSTGGMRIVAQHVLDEEFWYVVATDGSTRSSIMLQPSEGDHADALIALEWLKNDSAELIHRVVG